MKPTFEKTVDVLVKAYLNDTLELENCTRCAVGNIIAGGDRNHNFYKHGVFWYAAIGLNYDGLEYQDFTHPDLVKTGYSVCDLLRIEKAFMRADRQGDINFNGLMAVVEVLAEIHGVDLQVKEQAKLLFVKA